MRLRALESIMSTNANREDEDIILIPSIYSELEKLTRQTADKESFATLAKNIDDTLLMLFNKYLPSDSNLLKEYQASYQKLLNGIRFAENFDPAVAKFKQSLDQIQKQAIALNQNELAKQGQLRK